MSHVDHMQSHVDSMCLCVPSVLKPSSDPVATLLSPCKMVKATKAASKAVAKAKAACKKEAVAKVNRDLVCNLAPSFRVLMKYRASDSCKKAWVDPHVCMYAGGIYASYMYILVRRLYTTSFNNCVHA